MNIRTLRSYERRGLPAEPERGNGGHRLHGENAVSAPRAIEAARRSASRRRRSRAPTSPPSAPAWRPAATTAAPNSLLPGSRHWLRGRSAAAACAR
nr:MULTISPECIES: MerR family DNA-binding transcriptional regulator [unclassified Streptomyces]